MIPLDIIYGFLFIFLVALVMNLFLLGGTCMTLDSHRSIVTKTEQVVISVIVIAAILISNIFLYYTWWMSFHGWYM